MGKPGSPYPCGRAALPRTGGWGNPVSPDPLRAGCTLPDLSTGRGMGNPGFPMFTLARRNEVPCKT